MNPILEWLQEEWFGLLSFAAGSGLALAFYLRQKKPKRLDYTWTTFGLFNKAAGGSWRAQITVAYEGSPLTNPHFVSLRVLNTGKRAVLGSEFVDPVTVKIPGDGLLGVQIADASSRDLRLQPIERSDASEVSYLTCRPALMNPGDWFELLLLHEGPPGGIRVSSRFADQEGPMYRRDYDYFGEAIHHALAGSPRRRGPDGAQQS